MAESTASPTSTPGTETPKTAPVWSERLMIKSYDVDFRRQASLESLCRYFLEAAWNHAEALGAGFSQLAAQNRTWVLSRLLVRIERFPNWGQEVTLQTWPREPESLFALRDFEFFGSQENPSCLAAGSSAWLVLDVHSRRPQRRNKFLAEIKTHSARATERDPEKLGSPPDSSIQATDLNSDAPEPGALGIVATATAGSVFQNEMRIQAKYSDEDLNGHVNSARYLRWLLDSYSLDWHRTHVPREVELNYLSECRGGETVRIVTRQCAPTEFFHCVFKTNGPEACRARIKWSLRE